MSGCCDLLDGHDIPSCPSLWEEKPIDIHLDLLHRRLSVRHVCEGIWHCAEAYTWGKQSIHPRLYVRLRDRDGILYPYTDELFQQSIEPVLDINVS